MSTDFSFDPLVYLANPEEPGTIRVNLLPNSGHVWIRKKPAESSEFRDWSRDQLMKVSQHPEAKRLALNKPQPYYVMAGLLDIASQRDYMVFIAACSIAHPDHVKIIFKPEGMPENEPDNVLEKILWQQVIKNDMGFPHVKLVKSFDSQSPTSLPLFNDCFGILIQVYRWILPKISLVGKLPDKTD